MNGDHTCNSWIRFQYLVQDQLDLSSRTRRMSLQWENISTLLGKMGTVDSSGLFFWLQLIISGHKCRKPCVRKHQILPVLKCPSHKWRRRRVDSHLRTSSRKSWARCRRGKRPRRWRTRDRPRGRTRMSRSAAADPPLRIRYRCVTRGRRHSDWKYVIYCSHCRVGSSV